MTTVHKNLTGADLHESKGVDTALNGQVYVSNGSGSGVWTTATSVITNTAFTTGDLKITWKTTADSTWIMADDSTIGDGSSSALNRANADTAALFALLWNTFNNSLAPVSGGRGVSAVADFAAHKTITLPKLLARALGVAGAGAGLTARPLGGFLGVETISISQANLPNIIIGVTGSLTVTSTRSDVIVGNFANFGLGGGANSVGAASMASGSPGNSIITSVGSLASGATASINGAVTQTAIGIMNPTSYINVMVKL